MLTDITKYVHIEAKSLAAPDTSLYVLYINRRIGMRKKKTIEKMIPPKNIRKRGWGKRDS